MVKPRQKRYNIDNFIAMSRVVTRRQLKSNTALVDGAPTGSRISGKLLVWIKGVSGLILKPVGRLLKERKPLQFIKAKGVAMLVPFDFAMIFHSFLSCLIWKAEGLMTGSDMAEIGIADRTAPTQDLHQPRSTNLRPDIPLCPSAGIHHFLLAM